MISSSAQPREMNPTAKSVGYFFVTGHARSGTNWTCSLLNLHPKVSCHGEYRFDRLFEGVKKFTASEHALGSFSPLREQAEEWFREFVKSAMRGQLQSKPGATWVGDRSPRPLEPLLPDSPHFVVIRDGRDVVVSRAFHVLRLGGPWAERFRESMREHSQAFAQDPFYFRNHPERLFADRQWLAAFAAEWRDWVQRDLETARKMNAGELPGRAMIVRYDDLHNRLKETCAAMYEFLGVDPAEAADPETGERTAPGFVEEKPHSLWRKGEEGDWMNYADEGFRRTFRESAGEMLIELGFEANNNW